MPGDYEILEQHVIAYQQDKTASSHLIASFQNLFDCFIKGICKKTYASYRRKSFFNFVLIHMPKSARTHYYQAKRKNQAFKVVAPYIDLIKERYSCYSEEDLYNTMVIVLLELATRYKSQSACFSAYVGSCFHYRLHERLSVYANDLTRRCVNDVDLANTPYLQSVDTYDLEILTPIQRRLNSYALTDEVTSEWVVSPCSPRFGKLNQFERKLIKLKYVDGYTDEALAVYFNVSRQTILRYKKDIITTIKKHG